MGPSEAEAVKAFFKYFSDESVFFNELDSYSIAMKLKTKSYNSGVSSDKRIGDFYNNPSFDMEAIVFQKRYQAAII